jgi:hypothetical protein
MELANVETHVLVSLFSFSLDPSQSKDQYADYWVLTQNHAKIMNQYSIANPKQWKGYCKVWGLTASYSRNSDGTTGYAAHQPNNDLGVISPTAACLHFHLHQLNH